MMLAPQMPLPRRQEPRSKTFQGEFTALADVWFDKLDAGQNGQAEPGAIH